MLSCLITRSDVLTASGVSAEAPHCYLSSLGTPRGESRVSPPIHRIERPGPAPRSKAQTRRSPIGPSSTTGDGTPVERRQRRMSGLTPCDGGGRAGRGRLDRGTPGFARSGWLGGLLGGLWKRDGAGGLMGRCAAREDWAGCCVTGCVTLGGGSVSHCCGCCLWHFPVCSWGGLSRGFEGIMGVFCISFTRFVGLWLWLMSSSV